MTMRFEYLPECEKEIRKLKRKYKSLNEDMNVFQEVVKTIPLGNNKHFHTITRKNTTHIIKARFFCKYLKGNTLRIVYAYHAAEQKITFLEMYHKSNKPNHNEERIHNYTTAV